jgi:hypothetical protein
MRAMRVLALTLALLVWGDTARLAAPHFADGHGWHVGEIGVRACVGVPKRTCSQAVGWASTNPWHDCADCIPPHRTLASFRPGDIAIQMSLVREAYRERPLRWPPRIRRDDVAGPFEGGPDTMGVVQRSGRLHGLNVSFFVFFGRLHPTAAQLARAQAELRTAQLP